MKSIAQQLAYPGLWIWVMGMVRRRVRAQDVDDTVQRIALRALNAEAGASGDFSAPSNELFFAGSSGVQRISIGRMSLGL